MSIDSKALIETEIARLQALETLKKNELLNRVGEIEQFFNPANQLRKLFTRRKQQQPALVDHLIDESVSAVADTVNGKINLPGKNTFVGSKINVAAHQAVSNFLYSNTYKIKAIGRAIIKNLFH